MKNIGDKVKIKVGCEETVGLRFDREMKGFEGQELIITKVYARERGTFHYRTEGNKWTWTDEWFEEEKEKLFKVIGTRTDFGMAVGSLLRLDSDGSYSRLGGSKCVVIARYTQSELDNYGYTIAPLEKEEEEAVKKPTPLEYFYEYHDLKEGDEFEVDSFDLTYIVKRDGVYFGNGTESLLGKILCSKLKVKKKPRKTSVTLELTDKQIQFLEDNKIFPIK